MKSRHAPLPPIPTSAIPNFSERINAFMSTPGLLARSPCMIATTSGMGVGFVRFPPTSGAGSRGTEPVRVDNVVALPMLFPPYPTRVPSALPLPAWDTTATDDRFNSCATGQLMDTRREQPRRSCRSE